MSPPEHRHPSVNPDEIALGHDQRQQRPALPAVLRTNGQTDHAVGREVKCRFGDKVVPGGGILKHGSASCQIWTTKQPQVSRLVESAIYVRGRTSSLQEKSGVVSPKGPARQPRPIAARSVGANHSGGAA